MKSISLVTVLVIALIAIFTNPPVEKHREAVKSKLNLLMQGSLYEKINKSDVTELESNLGSAIGSMLGSAFMDPFINMAITSDNYIICSITKLSWNGETKIIGFGFLGNVFLSREIDNSLKDEISNAINSK